MNCDRLAPYYETLEHLSFGRSLEQRRFAFLDDTKNSRSAILGGDGDGRFLARLLLANRGVQVDFVDLSPKMIQLAQQRIAPLGQSAHQRVRFFAADIREFQPRPGGYDLIATHFFLDCFTHAELARVVQRLVSWATPGAQWIVSEFREPPSPVLHLGARALIRSLYAAFRLTTGLRVTRLPDYPAMLAAHGLRMLKESNSLAGLLHSSMWVTAQAQTVSR